MSESDLLKQIQKLYLKITEIMSLMKSGEFIVAFEKLGGVSKVLAALGAELQRRERNTSVNNSTVKTENADIT